VRKTMLLRRAGEGRGADLEFTVHGVTEWEYPECCCLWTLKDLNLGEQKF
jgi:hypothetical protein